jgi:hypothetical protein
LHKHNIKEMEETELLSVVWSQYSKSTEGKWKKKLNGFFRLIKSNQ